MRETEKSANILLMKCEIGNKVNSVLHEWQKGLIFTDHALLSLPFDLMTPFDWMLVARDHQSLTLHSHGSFSSNVIYSADSKQKFHEQD